MQDQSRFIFSDAGPFDSSRSTDIVTVAASDSVVMLLGPTLHKLPFESPLIMNSMIWHHRTHRVGLHRWIREMVRRLTRSA